jgi:protein ImuB
MRWLALYFPELPTAVFTRGMERPGALAVTTRRDGRECVSRCTPQAVAQGVRPGMTPAAAQALSGGLRILPRDAALESATLETLAAWAYGFSSRIALEPLCLLIEIGGSLRLFGGLPALLERLLAEAQALGHELRWAAAPTPTAAGLLARVHSGRCVSNPDDLQLLLHDIPLDRLTRDPQALRLLCDLGLSSIGACLALPRPELARRVGPGVLRLLDRLLGRAPDPRPFWQPAAQFHERMPLLYETHRAAALVFPARRLIQSLCAFLRARGGGAQRLVWRVAHRDLPSSTFDLGFLRPERDPERMLELLRGRLERLQLPAAATELDLEMRDWQPFVEASADLFASEVADPGMIERLHARLGAEAVRGIAPCADHRPERAWRLCTPGETGQTLPAGPRPLWLLAQPQPLDTRRGQPSLGGVLSLVADSERIETGWWDGQDIARDYFRARDATGETLWIYRDRHSGGWYLQGVFG